MKRKDLSGLLFVISAFLIIFSINTLIANAIDKKAIAAKAMMKKYKYITAVGTFNARVDIMQIDKSGRSIKKYTVILEPGELPEVPEEGVLEEGIITWRDIAKRENTLARGDPDPIAQWFIEARWRARINRLLDKVENKLKQEYPGGYRKRNISLKSITDALGIDSPIGFLTGQQFVKVPNRFGGRVPKIDPKVAEKALATSRYLSMYMSSTPLIKEIMEKIGDPETAIQPASEAY